MYDLCFATFLFLIRSFSVCDLLIQCSYDFQVNSDVLRQGECQKLSLKILEVCQQVCRGVIVGLFSPYAAYGVTVTGFILHS